MLRNLRGLAAAVVVCAALAACAGDAEPEPEPSPPWGLTGLPNDTGSDPTVVVVKVENTPAGRPQLGIGSADLVVQELVEGGLTRLAAMYQSDYPTIVGPVRSARVTDIGVVLPTNGTLVASGSSGTTLAALNAAEVPFVTEGQGTGFSRDPARRAPYNIMLDVAALAQGLPSSPMTGTLLPFGDVPADAPGAAAAGVDLRWPSGQSTFAYDAATDLWTRTDLADADGFSFTNVVALTLQTRSDGGVDSSGSVVPTMITEGSGAGVVATQGRTYPVTWSKQSPSSPWVLSYSPTAGEAAATFTVPAGRTWLALLPEQGGRVDVVPAPEPEPQS